MPRVLIADRRGEMHDPLEVAEELDAEADRRSEATGEFLHDAADIIRGLVARINDGGPHRFIAALGKP